MSRSSRRKTRKSNRSDANGRRARPHETPGPARAEEVGGLGDACEAARHLALQRLAEIALMPMDGEGVSSAQIRIIEASRKACIDLLRELDREERRIFGPHLKRQAAPADSPAEESPEPEPCDPARLRPGDAEVLADLLDEEELEELGAIASIVQAKRQAPPAGPNGVGESIRAGPA